MKKIISEKIVRIIKARPLLEKKLTVSIKNKGNEITIRGTAQNEYTAEQVIRALGIGFPMGAALMIKEEDGVTLETINIKDYTNRKDLERVRGRIIGTQGKAKQTIANLTDTFIEVRNNDIAFIGYAENVEQATEAVIAIIKGAKQSNMYAHLERNQIRPVEDLGLKGPKK